MAAPIPQLASAPGPVQIVASDPKTQPVAAPVTPAPSSSIANPHWPQKNILWGRWGWSPQDVGVFLGRWGSAWMNQSRKRFSLRNGLYLVFWIIPDKSG